MGKETLQTLAEIKMHVRDEHITHGGMKTRLKRRFGTVDTSAPQDPAGPPTSSPFPAQVSGIVQASQIPSASPMGKNPSDAPPNAVETEDCVPDGSNSVRTLGEIVDQFVQQGELDGGELENGVLAAPPPQVTINTPVSLEDLFDFSRNYWVAYHQRTSRRSLGDEMEAYSLLDTDLPGEEGTEVAIDETTGEVLTLNC